MRAEEAGRPRTPLASKTVRVRPGLLRGSWVKSGCQTGSFSGEAGGAGALVSEGAPLGALGRSCS